VGNLRIDFCFAELLCRTISRILHVLLRNTGKLSRLCKKSYTYRNHIRNFAGYCQNTRCIGTEGSMAASEQPTTQATRIVAVDDDPNTLELVRLTLARGGYECTGVNDPRQALDKINELQPSVVLLDLMMPQINGWEVYQSIRANESTKHIPVIIMTAMSSGMDRVLGLRVAQVADYINKPFSPTELLGSVGKVIAARAAGE
jgi:two-component system, OmpR family, response regulator VicR